MEQDEQDDDGDHDWTSRLDWLIWLNPVTWIITIELFILLWFLSRSWDGDLVGDLRRALTMPDVPDGEFYDGLKDSLIHSLDK